MASRKEKSKRQKKKSPNYSQLAGSAISKVRGKEDYLHRGTKRKNRY